MLRYTYISVAFFFLIGDLFPFKYKHDQKKFRQSKGELEKQTGFCGFLTCHKEPAAIEHRLLLNS